MRHRHPANVRRFDQRTLGERVADSVAESLGSWRFIIAQAVFTAAWIVLNSVHGWHLAWDSPPYVMLNLVYSFQAGFTGPLLLLSQNRQAQHDRMRAEHDYEVNERSLALTRRIAQHLNLDDEEATS